MRKAQRTTVRKELYSAALLTLLVMVGSVIAIFVNAAVAEEPQHRLIVLNSDQQAVTPDPFKVKPGTTIIWINYGKEPVTIIFKTKIGMACKAPVNFHADLFGHYETGQIQHGATASICFIDKGKFAYEVKRIIGKERPVEKILPATIVVE